MSAGDDRRSKIEWYFWHHNLHDSVTGEGLDAIYSMYATYNLSRKFIPSAHENRANEYSWQKALIHT